MYQPKTSVRTAVASEDNPDLFYEAEERPNHNSHRKTENSMAKKIANPVVQANSVTEFATDVIDAMNAIQLKMAPCGPSLDVQLPRIAVVGPENGGKSSVLQAIVGKDFLPKGPGLVTRRPIIIQLNPIPEGEEYGVFTHVPKEGGMPKKFDFPAIRQEITDETNRLLEPKCFSSEPIYLQIYSPKVLKLTLVDLPGLVQVPVKGQDDVSVKTVTDMVYENVEDPGTLILAIIPATQPIAGSEALALARKVDPECKRTIGVLTKLDLMDAGTNALNVLENREFELKRGYVGVVNAGKKDVDKNTDIASILENERKFFTKSCYSHLAHRMGIPYLQKMLQKTLRQHIKEQLPSLRNDLSLKLSKMQREIKTLDKNIGQIKDGNHYYIVKLVQTFVRNVNTDLFGYSDLVSSEDVGTGFYIHHKMYTEVQKNLNLDLMPDDKELTIMIAGLSGIRNYVTVPALAMDVMCRKVLCKFKEPLQLSINCVKQILVDSVIESTQMMEKYPSLKNEVIFLVRSCINELTELAEERLLSHIDAEMFYVNTAHPDFDGSEWDSIAPAAGCEKYWNDTNSVSNPVTSREDLVALLMSDEPHQKKTKYISSMIMGYLKIIKKSISDLTIKYIAYFLVKKFAQFLEEELVYELLNSSNLQILMQDCEDDIKLKEEMEKTCVNLQEALDLIQAF